MIARFISGKYRNPTGVFGRLIGNSMARNNDPEVAWTVSLLDIQPNNYVLEVGFGPGMGIQYASQKAVNGWVAGIDSSETMVQVARKRNAAAISTGRVNLRYGSVSALPYPDASFDKAYTTHCIYFWANPNDDLRELRRVLKPGGVLAVTIMPKADWPTERTPPADLFHLYSGSEVAQLLSDAGFRDVGVETYPEADESRAVCVLGTSNSSS